MINLNIPFFTPFFLRCKCIQKEWEVFTPFIHIFGEHLYFSFFQKVIIQCLVSCILARQGTRYLGYNISYHFLFCTSLYFALSHSAGNVFPENWWRRDVWHICKMRIWLWAKIRRKGCLGGLFTIFPMGEGQPSFRHLMAWLGLALKLESICIRLCKSSNVQYNVKIWNMNA